jgi:hypothetical protein
LHGQTMGENSVFVNTFRCFFSLFFDGLDASTWHTYCFQQIRCQPAMGGGGGGAQPPHFFEIFLLDRVRDEVGGGYSQSLIQFYPILYNV